MMSKKKKAKISSYLLIVFIWQVTFLCIGHKFDPSLQNQYASLIEDIQEEEEDGEFQNGDSITDGFDFTEVLEEDGKLCPDFTYRRITNNLIFGNISDSGIEFQFINNLFSPPELSA